MNRLEEIQKRMADIAVEIEKEDVAAVSVRFGLIKGLLNKKVTAIVKEKETEEADKALVLHELLTEV